MIKNLSKSRFIFILVIAIILISVIIAQFITLSVLKGQENNLNSQLNEINSKIEKIPSEEDIKNSEQDRARWDLGYVYDDEKIFIEA